MSYTRRFTKDITVHYSGSVSYPASQNGGSTSYSGSTTETIVFDVLVDTDPFDSEVHNVNKHVDLLTGSVVATEAAHVKTIYDTTTEIGDTIISGFFKTVKSDISQQITELKTRAEALLMQLNKLAIRCNDKKRQMGEDYQRISSRYAKIFTDLNNELENRIHSIDEPIFLAASSMDEIGSKTGGKDQVSTVSVSAGEHARVHSMLAANIAKRQAVNAIEKGRKFLHAQYETDRILDKCLRPGGQAEILSSPFCVMDGVTGPGTTNREVFTSPLLENESGEQLAQHLDDKEWNGAVKQYDAEAIGGYFRSEVAQIMQNADNEHDRRVAALTSSLFDLSKTSTPE